MKLRNPRETPPGGFYFITDDGRTISGASNLRRLQIAVEDYLSANGKPIPADLGQIIEDQICERVPNKCWKGFGDRVATAIQGVAGAVDAVIGTSLKAAAKSCKGCGRRKRTLNRLTS